MEKITDRSQYDAIKAQIDELIAEASAKGMLEPDMDNEYTRKIAELSAAMANYEDEYLDIIPLRKKSPIIVSIENYFFIHNLKQKDGAKLLGINESVFSQIMTGKRKITMPIAKKLHQCMGIDASMILNFA